MTDVKKNNPGGSQITKQCYYCLCKLDSSTQYLFLLDQLPTDRDRIRATCKKCKETHLAECSICYHLCRKSDKWPFGDGYRHVTCGSRTN